MYIQITCITSLSLTDKEGCTLCREQHAQEYIISTSHTIDSPTHHHHHHQPTHTCNAYDTVNPTTAALPRCNTANAAAANAANAPKLSTRTPSHLLKLMLTCVYTTFVSSSCRLRVIMRSLLPKASIEETPLSASPTEEYTGERDMLSRRLISRTLVCVNFLGGGVGEGVGEDVCGVCRRVGEDVCGVCRRVDVMCVGGCMWCVYMYKEWMCGGVLICIDEHPGMCFICVFHTCCAYQLHNTNCTTPSDPTQPLVPESTHTASRTTATLAPMQTV